MGCTRVFVPNLQLFHYDQFPQESGGDLRCLLRLLLCFQASINVHNTTNLMTKQRFSVPLGL